MVKICQCRKQNKQTSAANTNLDEFNDELELIMGDTALGSLLPQNCIFSFQLPATPLSNAPRQLGKQPTGAMDDKHSD